MTADNRVDYADADIDEWQTRRLWWQEQHLQQTASGYGSRLLTQWIVRIGKRWHRVYCAQYSNVGTCYIVQGPYRRAVSESFPVAGLTAKGKGN
jgi:hypothetical protein